MPIAINGAGTITGLSAGGLPDDSIITADIANSAVTDGKIAGMTASKLTGTVADARISALTASKLTGALPAISGASLTNLHTASAGKHTIWIPAGAMRARVSNGCAGITDVETTAGRPDMTVLEFDKEADEFAQFSVAFPKSWNLGTITFQVWWTGLAATTGVAWGLQGTSNADNTTLDAVFGTAVVVTDDAQGAVEEVLVTSESGAVTIANTPADDDICIFQVFRDVSDGNDDMAGDARLLGVKLFFTTDAETDA